MNENLCVSCDWWIDAISHRTCQEVHGECSHPKIKELIGHYLPVQKSQTLKIDPEPFTPSGAFGCILWKPAL